MTDYLIKIIICILITETVIILLPAGNFKSFARLTCGIIVTVLIITPFFSADNTVDFIDFSEYFQTEEYKHKESDLSSAYENYIYEIYERSGVVIE